MKLNCKPGDLAVFVRDPPDSRIVRTAGVLVTILRAAPAVSFALPDGLGHSGCPPRHWLVQFQRPVPLPVGYSKKTAGFRSGVYACAPDFALHPIRDPGEDAVDEMVLRKPVPTPETV